MAIQITYNGGVYEINGLLNAKNANVLTNHFEVLLKKSAGAVITLNKILDIDTNAVKKIVEFYNKAVSSDQLFYIIGKDNQLVNEQFKALNSNEILL